MARIGRNYRCCWVDQLQLMMEFCWNYQTSYRRNSRISLKDSSVGTSLRATNLNIDRGYSETQEGLITTLEHIREHPNALPGLKDAAGRILLRFMAERDRPFDHSILLSEEFVAFFEDADRISNPALKSDVNLFRNLLVSLVSNHRVLIDLSGLHVTALPRRLAEGMGRQGSYGRERGDPSIRRLRLRTHRQPPSGTI